VLCGIPCQQSLGTCAHIYQTVLRMRR
jgi:hypothetical protein